MKNYNTPEIKGKSEKQVKYAEDLRSKWMRRHEEALDFIVDEMQTMEEEKDALEAACAEIGLTVIEYFEKSLKEQCDDGEFFNAWKCLTCSDAGELITLLR